jgi:natural product biosynthesis luciferase-like monooxygenase protein
MSNFTSFIIGEGPLTLQCAEALQSEGHSIFGLITSNPTIRAWAVERRLRCIDPAEDFLAVMRRQPFDYLFSIVNYRLLPKDLLVLPRMGAVNFHDSLLPKYAGAYAPAWAIMSGETVHGVTWHAMTDVVDAGDILSQQQFEISAGETAHSLNVKCFEAGLVSFKELIHRLAGDGVTPLNQDLAERTYFPFYLRPPGACILAWNYPALDIEASVRALEFGPISNPLGRAKIAVRDELILVGQVHVLGTASGKTPGTVVSVTNDSISVATSDQDLAVSNLCDADGRILSVPDFVKRLNLQEGDRFEEIDAVSSERLTRIARSVCKSESYWVAQLSELQPFTFQLPQPVSSSHQQASLSEVSIDLPDELAGFCKRADGLNHSDLLVALFALFLARIGDICCFDLGLTVADEYLDSRLNGAFASQVPLRINVSESHTLAQSLEGIRQQIVLTREHRTYLRDIRARYPAITNTQNPGLPFQVAVQLGGAFEDRVTSGSSLTLVVGSRNASCRFRFKPQEWDANQVDGLKRQFEAFLRGAVACADQKTVDVSLLSEVDRHRLLVDWNDTARDFPRNKCLHHLFEDQAALTPEAVALVFEDKQLTYRELNEQANILAHRLIAKGVESECLVAICVDRSLEMMVGLLAVLKAGGAYVPLDPNYPKDRLRVMLEDCQATMLLTQRRLLHSIPRNGAQPTFLDDEFKVPGDHYLLNPRNRVQPDNLAYVIYTSGSTGNPKGVMLSHGNVVNFCTGMDDRIGTDSPGVWLAVTSISFDISVLELFWTLARGFKVVIYSGKEIASPRSKAVVKPDNRAIQFSLAYFASEGETVGESKYRLLLEGAKFADQNGFCAVWTPERHFHSFGGLYPNPSVTSAAIAAVTSRVQIRAGSVVLPLHNPIRVAEEWSVVDNLSGGRVAISFASGWHPNDFVLAPENYQDRKELTLREIETVQRLWRGESVKLRNGAETDYDVRILPRPIQPELPVWLTAAGHPDTFRVAGEMGANLLTHLLGQTVEELAAKIKIYEQAWLSSGHDPKGGHITLMLHTFVSNDTETARKKVYTPFRNYLSSSVDLIKKAQWTFPAFKSTSANGTRDLDIEQLTEDEMDALLDHAFNRYFETSGLFGSLEKCDAMVESLRQIGIDEIACLIDFGVDVDSVMSSLEDLKALKDRCSQTGRTNEEQYSVPMLMAKHEVTHLQCTPSLATILMHDDRSQQAFRSLKKLLLGGEVLPQSLADQVTELVGGEVINMYGPTETTIWSTTSLITRGKRVNIGRPIANTDVYILDQRLRPVPVGMAGELVIGGAGVARGYLRQPDLTAEKFPHNPFKNGSKDRVYRTGDLARYLENGELEFIGRLDQQVKIRGFRIELGEIESILNSHPAIREAVVTVREPTPIEKQVVAYVIARKEVSVGDLRNALSEKLPEQMIPGAFVFLKKFPLTPNGKLDRRLLPDPEADAGQKNRPFLPPRTAVEEVVTSIFGSVLNLPRIGIDDDFFALGGHSLLGAQVISRLRDVFQIDLPLRRLFEAPTGAELAKALIAREPKPGQAEKIAIILKSIQDLPAQPVEYLKAETATPGIA